MLDGRGWTYRVVDTVNAALEHVPGSLGAAARRMADAGVNIETMFASGMEGNRVKFVFGVSDAGAARAALGDAAVD